MDGNAATPLADRADDDPMVRTPTGTVAMAPAMTAADTARAAEAAGREAAASEEELRRALTEPLPIAALVDEALRERGLLDADLARLLPFANRSKTVRRFGELREGKRLPDYVAALTPALGLDHGDVERAEAGTAAALAERARLARAAHRARAEAHWLATFRPHAIWRTERSVPQSIHVVALAGGPDRFLRHDFPADLPASRRVLHARAALPSRVLAFGRAIGFAVNDAPNYATVHAPDGTLLGILPRAVQTGEATLGGIERVVRVDA